MEVPHGSHYTMFSVLRNLESHACYEDFIMAFSWLFTVTFFINCFPFYCFLIYIDILSSSSGRFSIFEGPDWADSLLLEVTAERGLWYGLEGHGQNCRS